MINLNNFEKNRARNNLIRVGEIVGYPFGHDFERETIRRARLQDYRR